jgi:hypothetical protein
MFEVDPGEWEAISADDRASIGDWDFPADDGETPSIPAGLDEWVHEAQLCAPGLVVRLIIG